MNMRYLSQDSFCWNIHMFVLLIKRKSSVLLIDSHSILNLCKASTCYDLHQQVDSMNKPGILLEVVQILADLDLIVKKAYISSDGGWFMDVFHVSDQQGNKIREYKTKDYIEKVLGPKGHLTDRIKMWPGKRVGIHSIGDHTAIELIGKDRPGLLSEISAVLAGLQINVVAAEVWTHNMRIACVLYVNEESTSRVVDDPKKLSLMEDQLGNILRGCDTSDNDGDSMVARTSFSMGFTHIDRRLHQMFSADKDYETCSLDPDSDCPPSSKPSVTIDHCEEKGYSMVNIRCKDRPKLLFDTVCTLTDMQYVVFHAAISSDGPDALQEYYIRHMDGCTLDAEGEKERVIKCLEAAVQRRVRTTRGAMYKGQSGPAVGGNSDPPGERAVRLKGRGDHGRGSGRERLLCSRRLRESSGHQNNRGPEEGDRAKRQATRGRQRMGQDKLLHWESLGEILGLRRRRNCHQQLATNHKAKSGAKESMLQSSTQKARSFCESEAMDKGELRNEYLNLCFENLMMAVDGSSGVSMEEVKVESGTITDWKDIPMELLLRIVSLVNDRTVIMVSEVCSGWRDAICLGLTHLSLVWMKKNMNNLVLSLAPKFTKLQSLNLRQDKPQLEDNAVEALARYCHDLQDLDLSKSFRLTDRSLHALAQGCPNLTKLNISGCSAFSDNALEYLTNYCRKMKILNLCGCVKAASDKALQAIGRNCCQLQSLNLGWCENVSDVGVMSLAFGCPQLRVLDLCGCVRITDDSVIALVNGCPNLTSLGLYYCQNITDRAMYSLAQSRYKHRHPSAPPPWESSTLASSSSREKGEHHGEGLKSLNISQCTALTPPAVQAVCDSFPALHTCPGRHSLIISGCLSLTSVHCACAFQAHRVPSTVPHLAH
ncbi:hypothetical protein SAY86_021819 [Trapa natans]|uniref:ACT domain-containing protein ACR n=1 Tax=Trapa natans TaxID=22666 RepID=A0AAN7RF24_TRANT|nr:hypothetical protein SAY86_021819 [Trapa natans]